MSLKSKHNHNQRSSIINESTNLSRLSSSSSNNNNNNNNEATLYSDLLNEEEEEKILCEFSLLLDKSRQLFNGLRELPVCNLNSNAQWQAYYGRTFEVYTKLWKYQQENRAILEQKYGLKRWQIGEIASKIGQLYYHYYLRTSEANYLNEAYSFYQAIQQRAYYSKVNKESKYINMVYFA
jgi:hypothetical protein